MQITDNKYIIHKYLEVIRFIFLDPPDSPPVIHVFSNGSTYKVTENDKTKLSCSVKGGNPLAKPKWRCYCSCQDRRIM